MDFLDLQVNCHVSLRSQQANVMFYQEPTRDIPWDTWTSSPMANFSSISNFGLNPVIDMECHRNRQQVNSGKAFYSSQDNYQGYYSTENQYEIANMSSSAGDPWSSYNYAFHPYSYHGYSHHDPTDVLQQPPLILPSQPYYSSWHVPYSRDSNHSYYHGQMYNSTAHKDLLDESNRQPFYESIHPTTSSSISNSHSTAPSMLHFTSNDHEKSLHQSSLNSETGQTISDHGFTQQQYKQNISSLPHPEPVKHSHHHTSNGPSVENFTQYSENHEQQSHENVGNFLKHDGRKHQQMESGSVLSRANKVTSMPVLSNHVRKQEKKMKRMLRELQKSEPQKAMQLMDFYHFHMTILEKQQHEKVQQKRINNSGSRRELNYPGDEDFQVLHVIQQVQQRLRMLGCNSAENQSRKPGFDELRKTRLLPKHAVKTLETWFEDNLSNPYPSRDQTLHLALDCGLTIEQVRKWFANKRNRSRNNKLYK